MALESVVAAIIIGLVAGVLAFLLIKHGTMGLIGDILVGIGGALVVAFMLPTIGISLGGGLIGAIILAVVGAVLALWAMRKAKTA